MHHPSKGVYAEPPGREQTRRALALAIRSLRKRARLSQEGLALASGLDRSYMGEIERALCSPTIETLVRLLPPLGITFARLAVEFEKMLSAPKPRRVKTTIRIEPKLNRKMAAIRKARGKAD